MKKFIFTLMMALASLCSATAQNVELVTCIVMEFKTGETLSIELTDRPKAQFEETELVLVSDRFEGRYETADIKRFYFGEVEAGIKAIEAADRKANGVIYDAGGREVGRYNGSIDAVNLPVGAYVVKTDGGKVFKVVKR